MKGDGLNNIYIARLRKLLKRKTNKKQPYLFYNARKDVFDVIWNNRFQIIQDNSINFTELYKNVDEDYPESLYKVNKTSFINETSKGYILNEEITNQLVKLLEKACEPTSNTILVTETRQDFKDVETEFEIEDDTSETGGNDTEHINELDDNPDAILLKPKPTFTFSSFCMNYLYARHIQYMFNTEIPQKSLSENSDFYTSHFEIISFLDVMDFPTKFTVTCTHKNKYGVECGNIVNFSHIHKHSTIKCTDSLEDPEGVEGHTIKNLQEAELRAGDIMKLYAYTVKDANSESTEEYVLYSLYELNEYEVKGNIVDSKRGQERLRILISKEHIPRKELEEPILIKDKNNWSFLHDIYKSVQRYLKKYHEIQLTNQNRVVAEFVILQTLMTLYYDFACKSLIAGKSGTGKSFIAKVITPLFTNSQVIVSGNDVTRNRLLGGRSNYQSTIFSSPYSPGYIATHDLVVLEEMTNEIGSFQDPKTDLTKNVMSMLKGIDEKGQEYDVGIQGSVKSRVRSSVVMFGNIEQLQQIRQEYRKSVRNKYKSLQLGEDLNFQNKWPLYKPIEFYVKEMANETLAKAHQLVRKDYLPRNWVTNLPEAEQNRILNMIILEDVETGYQPIESNMNEKLQGYIHRAELEEELKQTFTIKPKTQLFEEVREWLNEEYFRGRNNIVVDKTINYNVHIRVKLMQWCTLLVHMQKTYYEQNNNLNTLTNDDKLFLKYYLQYNYNTVSIEEASGKKTPYINDLLYDTDTVEDEEYVTKKRKEKEEEIEKRAREGIPIDTSETSNILDDIGDMEDFDGL